MDKTCSNCKHSCYIEQSGTDEMILVCIHTCSNCKYSRRIKQPGTEDMEYECTARWFYNCHLGFTKVGENDVKKCWESAKEDDYNG